MNKRAPCKSCPFRKDIAFPFTISKVQSILDELQGDGDFPCHNTTPATGNLPS